MRDINEDLRLQDEINKEINLILLDLNTVEKKEKEVVYLENKLLLEKLKSGNEGIARQTINEFTLLKNRKV